MRRLRPIRPAPDAGANAEAFRERMLPHLDAAHRFARMLTRDASAAEDIVQDGYLRAYRAFASYRGEADRAWLFAILRNCWRDGLRQRQHEPLPDDHESADDWTPEAALIAARATASVREAIEALPTVFREVVVLRELDDMRYREIAEVIDAPIGTVMSRLARGRELLATMLRTAQREPFEEASR